MRKNIPIFIGIAAFLLAVVFILEFIGAIISLNDISSYSGLLFEKTRGLLIFEIISAALVILSCFPVFYFIGTKKEESRLYTSICIPFVLFTVRAIIDTFWAFSIINSVSSSGVSMPGSGIAKLVFLFAALISLLVGSWLEGSFTNDDKANVFTIIAMGALFVCCIISFISMDSSTNDALTIVTTIFLTLSIIVAAIAFLLSFVNEDTSSKPVYRPGNVVYPRPKEVESDDTAEQLRKLKKLFDDGVITAEEYEEKRKKYVDKL